MRVFDSGWAWVVSAHSDVESIVPRKSSNAVSKIIFVETAYFIGCSPKSRMFVLSKATEFLCCYDTMRVGKIQVFAKNECSVCENFAAVS